VAGKRILLVEDDGAVAEITALLLRKFGHSPIVAWSVDSAMSIWAKTQGGFDLLIVDYLLGARSGANLAINLGKEKPTMPIILMSGFHLSNIEIPDECVKFLSKPFTPEQLREAVESCFK